MPVTNLPGRTAAVLLAVTVGTAGIGHSASAGFAGLWQVKAFATMIGDSVFASSQPPGPQIVEFIEHDGRVTMTTARLTPEMESLGFKPVNTGFDGVVEGSTASGSGSYWRVPFWERDASECPRPAGLKLESDREMELIAAVPLRESCQWTFASLSESGAVQRVVTKLSALFVVREVRFFDQPDDGSPGERITKVADDQKFRIEVEFELAPPAAVYVDLGSDRLVSVRPTRDPSVFTSNTLTRAALVPGARL